MSVGYTFSVMWRDGDDMRVRTPVYDHDTGWKLKPVETCPRGQTRDAVELGGGCLVFSNMRVRR